MQFGLLGDPSGTAHRLDKVGSASYKRRCIRHAFAPIIPIPAASNHQTEALQRRLHSPARVLRTDA